MSSTVSKRQQVWVCWQEPEADRGKFSEIPTSWIAKCLTGDGVSPGSVILCRWPRSDELFTAKVINDPSPNDLAKAEVMEVPMFVGDDTGGGGQVMESVRSSNRKPANRFGGDRSHQISGNQSKPTFGNIGGMAHNEDNGGAFMLSNLKRFFLSEMTKISGEMQANFDILGHRIGALEVNMKCVRERVERIENILNTAVQDLDGGNFGNAGNEDGNHVSVGKVGRKSAPKVESSIISKRSQESKQGNNAIVGSIENEDEEDSIMPPNAVVIPRPSDQRPRRDRNPRPRAVVVTCPRNRNIVLLGGDERYRMPLVTYLDAIRHAKRPTATYMVTALLRRHLPVNTLAKLCVNERQLANTKGGELVDEELLEVLKKQGRMQFPHTSVQDPELMLRIEDVARDVRRKIKLKKAGFITSSSKRSTGGASGSTPISMVMQNRMSMGEVSGSTSSIKRYTDDDADGNVVQYNDEDGEMEFGDGSADFNENPQALPMFS